MGAAVIPALIGGIASIAGTMMESSSQQAAVDAQNRAQQAAMQRQRQVALQEDARQEQMRKQQQGIMDESLSKQDVNSVSDQLDQTKADRSEAPVALTSEMAAMSPDEVALPSRANAGGVTVVGDPQAADLGTRLAQQAQNTRKYLQAKSDVGAYGQLFGDRARDYALANEGLDFLGKKRQGSLDIAQQESQLLGQDFADSIHPNLFAGSLVKGIGGLVTKIGQGGYG